MNQPKQRPIIYSEPMAKATIDNLKTQTRRTAGLALINENPDDWIHETEFQTDNEFYFSKHEGQGLACIKCPYGQPGDQLYVKETFYAFGYWVKLYQGQWHFEDATIAEHKSYRYFDNTPDDIIPRRTEAKYGWYKRPAIFMPRIASRFTLQIESILPERLKSITEEDAKQEGLETDVITLKRADIIETIPDGKIYKDYTDPRGWLYSAKASYLTLWCLINGKQSLDNNPWVWAIKYNQLQRRY